MYTTIQKWGNSQGVRLPKTLLDGLGIRENDRVEILQDADAITIRRVEATPHKTLEERLVAFYRVPIEQVPRLADTEIDWGEARGAEAW